MYIWMSLRCSSHVCTRDKRTMWMLTNHGLMSRVKECVMTIADKPKRTIALPLARTLSSSSVTKSISCTGVTSCGTLQAVKTISNHMANSPRATGFRVFHFLIMRFMATNQNFLPNSVRIRDIMSITSSHLFSV